MRVFVGGERFGKIREAFRKLGHDAYSCDFMPSQDGDQSHHLQGNMLDFLDRDWDLAIFHPDCTYLCISGLHWNKKRPERIPLTEAAIKFAITLMECSIPHIALENPIGCLSTRYRKPDQIIHPWQFGERANKATCLWLKNLPLLKPTNIVGGRKIRQPNQTTSGQNRVGPQKNRAMIRSKTYQGIADAMAAQWSNL